MFKSFETFEANQVKSVSDALHFVNLDWTVNKHPIYDNFGQTIPGYQSIVRSDSNKVLGIVKSRYQIINNLEAFSCLDELLGNGMQIANVSSYSDGRIVAIEAKMPNLAIEPVKNDIVEIRLSFSTSHDGSKSLRMLFSPYRLVCLNGMKRADNDLTDLLVTKHTESSIAKIGSFKDLYEKMRLKTENLVYASGRMAKQFVSDADKTNYLLRLFGYETKEKQAEMPTRTGNVIKQILDLTENGKGTEIPGVKDTVWGLYNAVTEYTDHYASVKGDNQEDSRRFSAMYGNNANLKELAFEQALQLTN